MDDSIERILRKLPQNLDLEKESRIHHEKRNHIEEPDEFIQALRYELYDEKWNPFWKSWFYKDHQVCEIPGCECGGHA